MAFNARCRLSIVTHWRAARVCCEESGDERARRARVVWFAARKRSAILVKMREASVVAGASVGG